MGQNAANQPTNLASILGAVCHANATLPLCSVSIIAAGQGSRRRLFYVHTTTAPLNLLTRAAFTRLLHRLALRRSSPSVKKHVAVPPPLSSAPLFLVEKVVRVSANTRGACRIAFLRVL